MSLIQFYGGNVFDKSHEDYEYAKRLTENSKVLVYHLLGERYPISIKKKKKKKRKEKKEKDFISHFYKKKT